MPVFSKDKKNFLFIHIPKAAGTTIEKLFQQNGYKVFYRTTAGTPINRVTRCTPQHLHAELLLQMFDLTRFDGIFTVVRNPYTRIRSEYTMRNKTESKVNAAEFNKWLRMKITAYTTNPFVNDNHIRPQVDFIVPGAKVFKLEDDLTTVFAQLKDMFQIEIPYEPGFKRMVGDNVSGYSSDKVPLNQESIEIINAFYAQDFSKLGYKTIWNEKNLELD